MCTGTVRWDVRKPEKDRTQQTHSRIQKPICTCSASQGRNVQARNELFTGDAELHYKTRLRMQCDPKRTRMFHSSRRVSILIRAYGKNLISTLHVALNAESDNLGEEFVSRHPCVRMQWEPEVDSSIHPFACTTNQIVILPSARMLRQK